VDTPGRPAPSVCAFRRVPKVELGVRLQDGRETTGDPIEDYSQLLIEPVERALAREIIDEELKTTERRLIDLHCLDSCISILTVVKPRLFDVPDLADAVDEEANHLVLYTDGFGEKSELRQYLSRNLAESQRRLSNLMETIYDFMDVLFEAMDENNLAKNVHIDHNFAIMLKYAAEGFKDVRRSEVARDRAMSAHQDAYRLEQRAKTARKRAKRRGVDDRNVTERAITHCRSVKAILWDRSMAANRTLTRR
jgi:hypothetical protein